MMEISSVGSQSRLAIIYDVILKELDFEGLIFERLREVGTRIDHIEALGIEFCWDFGGKTVMCDHRMKVLMEMFGYQ
jgi:hypothetical protein